MSSHHPPRHCFTNVMFASDGIHATAFFTEGEVYVYDFTDFPAVRALFVAHPTGTYFDSAIRRSHVPFKRN